MGAGLAAAGTGLELPDAKASTTSPASAAAPPVPPVKGIAPAAIDFRYAPTAWQTAFCFPDDTAKSLVGERGDLRYGYDRSTGVHYFPLIFEFSVAGIDVCAPASQRFEAPHIPIVHTHVEHELVQWDLMTFAGNLPGEGRVDNVLMTLSPTGAKPLDVVPLLNVRTITAFAPDKNKEAAVVRYEGDASKVLFVADRPLKGRIPQNRDGFGRTSTASLFEFGRANVSKESPLRLFFRVPQQGQSAEALLAGLKTADELLEHTREFWNRFILFGGTVSLTFPGREGEFITACARNIFQAREVRDGKLTFQVGAADYRGLWIVDGHFILEAARYLGHDAEAQQGLETTWSKQREDGGIFAGAGDAHWKDTSIAMFTLVRQAELAQDWSLFRQLQPNVLRAVSYIRSLRDSARTEDSAMGRYGLLPRGMGDGGLLGKRSELTNTLWTLVGLKAVADAADSLQMSAELAPARQLYNELRAAFDAAARDEMRSHPAGFDFLPMLMKEARDWSAPDEWDRPRPQIAQWALSHCIYPGLLFSPNDPITQGHIRLMQESTQEDIPAETGWAVRGGVWSYNAAFVAQVYLWAGLRELARRTFIGFLNHASPLYCWREEQPLQGQFVSQFLGDMPHNWASAECIRYLRHSLVMEDGMDLRLLEGITAADLQRDARYELVDSPTRFGRITMSFEPMLGGKKWVLQFRRGNGPQPRILAVPMTLGNGITLTQLNGKSPAGVKGRVEIPGTEPAVHAEYTITRGPA